jgi:type VII secretion-associated serine protease mycosin
MTRYKFRSFLAATTASAMALSPAGIAHADATRNAQWHLKSLEISDVHKISRGEGAVVAVIDTGVYPHPDIRNNLLKGTDVVAGGKGDGQVDNDGHGTEMAGLIAGHGRGGQNGVLGIAPSAKILPVKDSNADDNGGSLTIAEGMTWASGQDVDVINVSSATGPSIALKEAVQRAQSADIVVVAGAGNRPRMVMFGYPAAMPGVLAVGAVDKSGKHAPISMTGPAVQLCAPGVDITSTEPKNRYAEFDGTSPATAIVSGAAALVRAKFPDLSANQVIERLTTTATDIGPPGRDNECGFGLLNIVKALTADLPADGGASSDVPATPVPSLTATAPEAVTAPDAEPTSNVPALVGGIGGVLLAGGLVAFLVVRRRRRP